MRSSVRRCKRKSRSNTEFFLARAEEYISQGYRRQALLRGESGAVDLSCLSCGTVGVGLLRPYCRCVSPTYIARAMKGAIPTDKTKAIIIVNERVEADSSVVSY